MIVYGLEASGSDDTRIPICDLLKLRRLRGSRNHALGVKCVNMGAELNREARGNGSLKLGNVLGW